MKADLLSKLLQVIEQIPKDVLYDFCCSYAQEHEELAMALVSEFWRPEIDALQSDGFNVYMYLDKELVDVDHLCCLAHARAKFKYAQEQGKDADAEYFITNIGRLYDLEEQYRLRHLTPQQIQQERQGELTSKIIQKIR